MNLNRLILASYAPAYMIGLTMTEWWLYKSYGLDAWFWLPFGLIWVGAALAIGGVVIQGWDEK